MKRFIVAALEKCCTLSHPVVHRRPWLWLRLPICPLATLSFNLGKRWGVDDAWTPVGPEGGDE